MNCPHRFLRPALALALLAIIPACGVGSSGGTLSPTVAPGIPTGLVALSGNRQMLLTWSASPAATHYVVKRSSASGGPYAPVPGGTGIAATSFRDFNLSNGATYYYVVSASNAFGQSTDSAEAPGVPGLKAQTLACGSDHTLALLTDGSLWAWGSNFSGELGIGTRGLSSNDAVAVLGISDVRAVAAAENFSMALRADGTVWAWGSNYAGVLGQTVYTPAFSGTPLQVPGLSGVTAIAAGRNHCLALLGDGSVMAWGSNSDGQLGYVAAGSSATALPVPGLSGVKAIAGGHTHSLAILSDDSVWGWGSNTRGELATVAAGTTPGRIINLTGAKSISAARNVSFAVTGDGTPWAWGSNGTLQLGSPPSGVDKAIPTPVSNLTNVVSLQAGFESAFALRSDGTLWSWGWNAYGELGIGALVPSITIVPLLVSGLTDARLFSSGFYRTQGIRADGTVWGFGRGSIGGGTGVLQSVPGTVPDLTEVTRVAGGGLHSLALRSDGSVWSWGGNTSGQLGDGTFADNYYRTQVRDSVSVLAGATRLAGGGGHSLALLGAGTVRAWGDNQSGQLGNNSQVNSNVAVTVSGLSTVTEIAAGNQHSLAILADKTVRAWGFNATGALGNNSTTLSKVPVVVSGLANIIAIAGGTHGSLALRGDGTVWAWGANYAGQVGDGTYVQRLVPVQVLNLANIISISYGDDHGLAAGNDGTVWAWGSNSQKQLGDPSIGDSNVPIQVPSLSGVVAVAAGHNHSLALRNDGTIWGWGSNSSGELGAEVFVFTDVPVRCQVVSGISVFSAGSSHNLAIAPDSTIWAWGSNVFGQMGIGTSGTILSPIDVTH